MSDSDDFTGTSGDELQTRTGWTRDNDGSHRYIIDITGTKLAISAGGGGSGRTLYTYIDQGSGDHETSLDNTQGVNSDNHPCAVRCVDRDNFVAGMYGGVGGSGYRLHKCVSGTVTAIILTQGDNVLPLTMKVSAEGEDYKLFEDGDQRGTTQVVTNAEISTSETSQGMVQDSASAGTTGYFDNFLVAALGAPPITLNQVSETNLAQSIVAVVGSVVVSVNQASEINLSQSIFPFSNINVPVNLVTETDLSQVIIPLTEFTSQINQVSEIDFSQSISPFSAVTISVNQVSETNLAQPIALNTGAIIAVNQTFETDTSQPFTSSVGPVEIILNQASETDLSQSINVISAINVSVNQVNEIDFSQAISPFTIPIIGLVSETNFAFSFTFSGTTFGNTFNAAEYFGTGKSVTIRLTDPVTDVLIPLLDNSCSESLNNPGVYIWDSTKLLTQPTSYQEYIYAMTDGTNTEGGKIVAFGSGLSERQTTQLDELYFIQGLDPAFPMRVTPNSRSANGIELNITGDGITETIVTRVPIIEKVIDELGNFLVDEFDNNVIG